MLVSGVVAVSLVAAGALVGWLDAGNTAASHVSVSWSPSCPASTLTRWHGHTEIKSHPGWRCDIVLRIDNESGSTIRVPRVEAEFMGSQGGPEAQAISTSAVPVRDDTSSGGVNADFIVDTTVAAHSQRDVTLSIGWRRRRCDGGGHFTAYNWLTVPFETHGRTFYTNSTQAFGLRTYDLPRDEIACHV
jgi:hypothetical protein